LLRAVFGPLLLAARLARSMTLIWVAAAIFVASLLVRAYEVLMGPSQPRIVTATSPSLSRKALATVPTRSTTATSMIAVISSQTGHSSDTVAEASDVKDRLEGLCKMGPPGFEPGTNGL
jgi:hypothetical protein